MSPDFAAAVLDTLLPGDAVLPAASRSGIDAAGCLSAHLPVVRAIAVAAGGESAFVATAPDARAELLRGIDRGPNAAAFKAMVVGVLNDYYTSDAVVSALGWRPGPPQPSGHEVVEADGATWQRLERVKQRKPLWR